MYTNEIANTEYPRGNPAASQALKSALAAWATDGGSTSQQSYNDERIQLSSQISEALLISLNQQIQHEQCNAHAYHAVSLYFGQQNLRGLEAYMAHQAEEERLHANRFIQHVGDRRGRVQLGAISAPHTDFGSPLDAARHANHLEATTSQMIRGLYEHACNEGDYALQVLLHWFITEQVEEEKWTQELVSIIERFQDNPTQLFMLDCQWGNRVKP